MDQIRQEATSYVGSDHARGMSHEHHFKIRSYIADGINNCPGLTKSAPKVEPTGDGIVPVRNQQLPDTEERIKGLLEQQERSSKLKTLHGNRLHGSTNRHVFSILNKPLHDAATKLQAILRRKMARRWHTKASVLQEKKQVSGEIIKRWILKHKAKRDVTEARFLDENAAFARVTSCILMWRDRNRVRREVNATWDSSAVALQRFLRGTHARLMVSGIENSAVVIQGSYCNTCPNPNPNPKPEPEPKPIGF